jgi:hypothetical protein
MAYTKEARPRSQLALDVIFDKHPFLTDRDGTTLELQNDRPGHAGAKLTTREVKVGGLAHAPSGTFTANPAWPGLPGPQPRPLDAARPRHPLGEGDVSGHGILTGDGWQGSPLVATSSHQWWPSGFTSR